MGSITPSPGLATPAPNLQSPVTNYQLPVTIYQFPLTRYHYPLATTYCLLTTDHCSMNLNDTQRFKQLDPEDMAGHINGLPDQLAASWQLGAMPGGGGSGNKHR